MSNTINLLNGIEFLYPDGAVISQLKRALVSYPECENYLVDAVSLGQLKSKNWVIEHLPDNMGLIFICAGWYGTLASMMFEKCRHKFDKIRSFDIDPTCAPIADTFNRPWVIDGWQFKASTMDILEMQYPTVYSTARSNGTVLELTEMPNTIINTSCEHIPNFDQWYQKIPSGMLLVLQSNNYFEIPEHVNCVTDIKEFSKKTPMTTELFSGTLELPKYNRFMKIGYK
jgi:hypothetical protein